MRLRWAYRLGQVASYLDPRPLPGASVRMLERYLSPPEQSLFLRLRKSDQRHSVAVAREVASESDLSLRERWVAIRAALLHDVGKDPRVATLPVRVANTLLPAVPKWLPGSLSKNVADLRSHGDRGAALLRRAGTEPAVASLVRCHEETVDASDLPQGLQPLLQLLRRADARH